MSHQINRRALMKSAAWAAPVVVASSAIPAYAASTENTEQGHGIIYAEYVSYKGDGATCYSDGGEGTYASSLTLTNDNSLANRVNANQGFGFNFVTKESPVDVTLEGLRYFIGIPAGLVNTGAYNAGVNIWSGSRNWKLTDAYRDSIDGVSLDFFEFTFTGQTSRQSTVWSDTSTRPTSWDDTFFNVQFTVNRDYCMGEGLTRVYSGYYADKISSSLETYAPYNKLSWMEIFPN